MASMASEQRSHHATNKAAKLGDPDGRTFATGCVPMAPGTAARRDWAYLYAVRLQRYRFAVIGCWACAATAFGCLAPFFVLNTTNEFLPPPGSPSERAAEFLRGTDPSYEAAEQRQSYGILLWSTSEPEQALWDLSEGNESAVAALSFDIEASVKELAPGRVYSFSGYFNALRDGSASNIAQAYVGPNSTSTVLATDVEFEAGEDSADSGAQFANALQSLLEDELLPRARQNGMPDASAQVIGKPIVMQTIEEGVEIDMCISDLIALPIALAVLATVVRSARLLLLSLASLGMSCGVAFGLMYFASLNLAIMSATMSVMMTVLVAMSLDYGLFLFTRLQEAIRYRAATPLEAVAEMLAGAGQTILVSGLTLGVACLSVLTIPQDAIRGMGLGAGVAVLVVLLANLTYVPTMLLTFPGCFCAALPPQPDTPPLLFWRNTSPSGGGPAAAVADDEKPVQQKTEKDALLPADENASRREELAAAEEAAVQASRWYRFGRVVTTAPVNVGIVAVLSLAVLPFALNAFDFPLAANVDMMLSRWSPVSEACTRWLADFGYGYGAQASTLVLTPRAGSNVTVLSVEFFDASRRIVDQLSALPHSSCSDFAGVSLVRCEEIPLDAAKGCGTAYKYGFLSFSDANASSSSSPPPPSTALSGAGSALFVLNGGAAMLPRPSRSSHHLPQHGIHALHLRQEQGGTPPARQSEADRPPLNESITASARADLDEKCAWMTTYPMPPLEAAARFSISLQLDPLTPDGLDWYAAALEVLDRAVEAEADVIEDAYLAGAAFEMADNVNVVTGHFPDMVLVVAIAIVVLTGVAFRSVVVPLRALVTTAITLLFCYGLVSLVYVHESLGWLHFYGLRGDGSLFFLGPPSSFAIQCGLAIDYDLFLLVRVREYWAEGHSTREAICRGLHKSGTVISAAGVIMAVAFCALLFSSSAAMNQLSLYLVSCVLFDTFVVRPLLVPALFSLAAETNWWPGDRCTERVPRTHVVGSPEVASSTKR